MRIAIGFGSIGLGLGLLTGGCTEPAGDCIPGGAGCTCIAGTCDPGLTCIGNACYPDNDDSTDEDDGSTDTDVEEPGGPVVESFTADTELIGGDVFEPVTFTAIVQDPDGSDDILSGRLVHAETEVEFGYFQNIGGATWQIVTSGNTVAMDASVAPGTLVFRAVFTDSTNKTGYRDLAVDSCVATCGMNFCADLLYDEFNCGYCDNNCYDYTYYRVHCDSGQCVITGGTDGYDGYDTYDSASFVPPDDGVEPEPYPIDAEDIATAHVGDGSLSEPETPQLDRTTARDWHIRPIEG